MLFLFGKLLNSMQLAFKLSTYFFPNFCFALLVFLSQSYLFFHTPLIYCFLQMFLRVLKLLANDAV